MHFYQYIPDTDIHLIDYSGTIDLAEGILRMELLEKHFHSYASRGVRFKILLDVRNTTWESIKTHNELSKIARQKFENLQSFTAVVNNQYTDTSQENEHWFTNLQEALDWLSCVH